MKLIVQSVNVWGEVPQEKNEAILWIERAGRTCYRSEDSIVEGSGITFVKNIIKRKHFSVIEHSNLVVRTKHKSSFPVETMTNIKMWFDSPFFQFAIQEDRVYIAGNWRAWIEWAMANDIDTPFEEFPGCLFDDDPIVEVVEDPYEIPDELIMITVEHVCNRAVSHELVRHRPASYSQESQRYCRYGSINFIIPWWLEGANETVQGLFIQSLVAAEFTYKEFLKNGHNAQEARVVLPNATATKIVTSAYIPQWKHMFYLRCAKAADPSMRQIMIPTEKEFKSKGWVS